MSNRIKVVIVLLGLILLLLVGLIAGRVGGIAIRNNLIDDNRLNLSVIEPTLRGVPINVRWTAADLTAVENQEVLFYFRDQQSELIIGQAVLADGEAIIEFPCEVESSSGSLVARDGVSGEVLGSSSVELFPPGPECIL